MRLLDRLCRCKPENGSRFTNQNAEITIHRCPQSSIVCFRVLAQTKQQKERLGGCASARVRADKIFPLDARIRIPALIPAAIDEERLAPVFSTHRRRFAVFSNRSGFRPALRARPDYGNRFGGPPLRPAERVGT